MQYQIYRKDTKKVVAWIESNSPMVNFIIHDDYEVRSGHNLKALEKNKVVKITDNKIIPITGLV